VATEEKGKTEYVRNRLLEARSEEELEEICKQLKEEPGVAEGTVKAEKSKLKAKGAFKFKAETSKAVVPKGPMPVEALIQELQLPNMVNGTREVFDSGVAYGMKSILIGVKIAQELSKMGIEQAGPIIKMAQEMRQTEGQVAKETGIAMGGEIASRMFDLMEQRFPQGPGKVDIASTPNPLQGLMARTMEMMINRMSGMMFGAQVGPTPGLVDKRAQGGQK
jgi:hypothetical protein